MGTQSPESTSDVTPVESSMRTQGAGGISCRMPKVTFHDNGDTTTIRVVPPRHTAARARSVADLTPVFDSLGVEVLSCSSPSAEVGETDITIVVADARGARPLDERLKSSLACSLQSALSGGLDAVVGAASCAGGGGGSDGGKSCSGGGGYAAGDLLRATCEQEEAAQVQQQQQQQQQWWQAEVTGSSAQAPGQPEETGGGVLSKALQQQQEMQQRQEQQQQAQLHSGPWPGAEQLGSSGTVGPGSRSLRLHVPDSARAPPGGWLSCSSPPLPSAAEDTPLLRSPLVTAGVTPSATPRSPISSGGRSSVEPGAAVARSAAPLPSPRAGSESARRSVVRRPSRIILSPGDAAGGEARLFIAIPKSPSERSGASSGSVRRLPSRRASALTPPASGRRMSLMSPGAGPGAAGDAPEKRSSSADQLPPVPNVAVAAAQLLAGGRPWGASLSLTAVDAVAAAKAAAAAAAAASSQRDEGPSGTAQSSPRAPAAARPPPPPALLIVGAAGDEGGDDTDAAAAEHDAGNAAAATAEVVVAAAAGPGPLSEAAVAEVGAAAAPDDDASSSCSEEWWCGAPTGLCVRELMSAPVHWIDADTDATLARGIMAQNATALLLVDLGAGQTPGLIEKRDLFKLPSIKRRRGKRRVTARDLMHHPALIVEAGTEIEAAAQALQEADARRAVVRDAEVTAGVDEATGGERESSATAAARAQWVGTISDVAIYRCLGFPGSGLSDDEDEPPPLEAPHSSHGRHRSGGDADPFGECGSTTPGTSRACTPTTAGHDTPTGRGAERFAAASSPVRGGRAAGGDGSTAAAAVAGPAPPPWHGAAGGGSGGSAAAAAGGALTPGRPGSFGGLLTLPDMLLLRERAAGGSFSSHSSAGSGGAGSGAAVAGAPSGASTAPSLGTGTGSGAGSVWGDAPDALIRYKTAASLWELDLDEVEIIRKIGEGSFGEVLLGNFRGTKVAVKRLHALDGPPGGAGGSSGAAAVAGSSHAAFQQFFEREIAILASIRHPNVVNFIGACHRAPTRCLVTEYCARGSLDKLLHKSGLALDLPKRIEFALDIARGMACLHAQQPIIIHRDLKTANLLVSARFEVKVADFGLSRIKDATHLQNSRAGLEGTIEYCAPEVLRGEPYTEKCDVWSFGVVLWELLTRTRPYSDMDIPVYLLMVNVGNGSLRLPPITESEASPGLCALVEACLSPVPAERPAFIGVLPILEAEYRAARAGAGHASAGGATGTPRRCESASGGSAAAAAAAVAAAFDTPRASSFCGAAGGAPGGVVAGGWPTGGPRGSLDLARAEPPGAAQRGGLLDTPRGGNVGGFAGASGRESASPSPCMQQPRPLLGGAAEGQRRATAEAVYGPGPYMQLPDPALASSFTGAPGGQPPPRSRLAWQDSYPTGAPSPQPGPSGSGGGPSGGGGAGAPGHRRRATLSRAKSMPMPRHASSWLEEELDAALAGEGSYAPSVADGSAGHGTGSCTPGPGGAVMLAGGGPWGSAYPESAGSDAASAHEAGGPAGGGACAGGWASPRAAAAANWLQQQYSGGGGGVYGGGPQQQHASAPWPAQQYAPHQPRTSGAASPFSVGSPSQGSTMMVMAMIGAAAAAQAAASHRLPSLPLSQVSSGDREREGTPTDGNVHVAAAAGASAPLPLLPLTGARHGSPVRHLTPRGLGSGGGGGGSARLGSARTGELSAGLHLLHITDHPPHYGSGGHPATGGTPAAAAPSPSDLWPSPRHQAPLGANSAAMLLQRHDSAGRSRSPTASPRAGAGAVSPFQQYSRLPSPDYGAGGNAVAAGGGGAGAAALGGFHRHASSRLSVQGSYELPAWQGSSGSGGGGVPPETPLIAGATSSGGAAASASPCGPAMGVPVPPSGSCTPPRQHLAPAKRHSLLRHESGREQPPGPLRTQSPFAAFGDNAAAAAAATAPASARMSAFGSPAAYGSPGAPDTPASLQDRFRQLQSAVGTPAAATAADATPAAAAAQQQLQQPGSGASTPRRNGPLPSPFALMQQ